MAYLYYKDEVDVAYLILSVAEMRLLWVLFAAVLVVGASANVVSKVPY